VIVLIGFMGAGKTTVGQVLAGRLGVPFLDTDAVIESQAGRPIRDIFGTDGEPAFRALEHEVIAGLLRGGEAVLALGGGSVEHPGTRRALAASYVVYLHVSYAEAMGRVRHDELRPLLQRPDLEQVYQRRQAGYRAVAAQIVVTDGREPADISLDIIGKLDQLPSAPA